MRRVRCILWDHDGVIVDTEPRFFEATRATLSNHGVELTLARWHELQREGRRLEDLVGTDFDLDLRDVRSRRDALYAELLAERDVVIDGVPDLLRSLAEEYRLALVTTSLRRFVDQLHGKSGLLDLFECVLAAEDCERHKPHPEPYLKAMDYLGAAPEHCVAVEDSPRGLGAALGAGVPCLIVRSQFMIEGDFAGAEAILGDIRELPAYLKPVA